MTIQYRLLEPGEEEAAIAFWTGFVMNSRMKDRIRNIDSYEEKLSRSSIPLVELTEAVAIGRQREQSHIRNGWASHLRTIPLHPLLMRGKLNV